MECSDVDYVVCSHGHSDHIGNNNLFLNAKHIVGFSISCKDLYFIHPFDTGEIMLIHGLFIIPNQLLISVAVCCKCSVGSSLDFIYPTITV